MKLTKIMKKKTLIIAVAAVLVCCCIAGSTLAWLVAETQTVTNTFTVGNINIDLAESDNLNLKMVPGSPIPKDPTVTVVGGSEACWLFVKIEKSTNFDDFMTYTVADDWTALSGESGVYYRAVGASDSDQPFAVLTGNKVTVKDSVTKAQMDALTTSGNLPTLSFTAYAVQKENVTDATTAWGYTPNP